jgi:trigger factor
VEKHDHNLNVKKVDRVSKTVVRLQLEYSGDTLKREHDRTSRQFAQQARLPGFRPGKAPVSMVKAKYKDEIKKEVMNHLMEAALHEAVEQTKLVPVSRPKVKVTQMPEEAEKPLEFEAEFEVQPEIELRNYKGVPVKRQPTEVTDEEVQKTLENIQDRLAVLEPTEAAQADKGLYGVVEVSYQLKGSDKTEAGKPFTVELGTGKLIPELDEAFLKMKAGETRATAAKFPDDFGDKELAGKEADFTLKLVELKKKVAPTIDDAMASQLKEGNTLDALKSEIRDNIAKSKQEESQRTQRKEIVDYLIATHAFEVPASLVEQQSRNLLQWMFEDMKRRGANQFPELQEKDIQELRKRAEQMVRSSLILKEIAIKEKIELDDSAVQGRVSEYAVQLNQSPEQTERLLAERGMLDKIRDEVLTDQVFAFLIENAQVVEAAPKR